VTAATGAPGEQLEVVLYGRAGCHLCDEARVGLERLRDAEGAPIALREVDIDGDEALHRELLERIPVIEIAGERVCELFCDIDAVRARIATVWL
jgi:hypothetical protein